MPQTAPHSRERRDPDEISLVDLALVLWRRKYWIVAVAAAVIALGVAYAATRQPIYESRAVVGIGMAQGQPVEPPEAMVQRYLERYRVGAERSDGAIALPYVESIDTSETSIVMRAHGASPEQAQALMATVAGEIVQDQTRVLQGYSGEIEGHIADIEAQVAALRQQIAVLDARIEAVLPEDSAVTSFLLLEKSNIVRTISNLENTLAGLRLDLAPTRLRPAEIMRPPSVRPDPVEPRVPVIIGLAVVLAAIAGIAAAILVEFAASVRRRMREAREGDATASAEAPAAEPPAADARPAPKVVRERR